MAYPQSTSYIPIDVASRKYGLSEKVLLDKIKSGTLAAVELKTGEVLVADRQIDPSLSIRKKGFEHLRGQKISMSEASRKYGISHVNFSNWAKARHISVLERGWKVLLDEVDVAFCSAVYKAKYEFYDGKMSGVKIFDKDGNPYQAKYPEVAAYKRLVRDRQRLRSLKSQSD